MLEQGGADNDGLEASVGGLATEATQLMVKEAIETISTDYNQEEEIRILLDMLSALRSIAAAKGIVSDFRVTLLTGTLTNISQVGGIQANSFIPSNQNLLATIGNINNVGL